MKTPYDTAYADGFIAGDRRAVNSVEDEIARLRAELAEAREVIKPFADYGAIVSMRGAPENSAYSIFGSHGKVAITFGDFRRARAFLDKADK